MLIKQDSSKKTEFCFQSMSVIKAERHKSSYLIIMRDLISLFVTQESPITWVLKIISIKTEKIIEILTVIRKIKNVRFIKEFL